MCGGQQGMYGQKSGVPQQRQFGAGNFGSQGYGAYPQPPLMGSPNGQPEQFPQRPGTPGFQSPQGTFPQRPGTPGFPTLPGGGVEQFPQRPGTFPMLPGGGVENFPQRPEAPYTPGTMPPVPPPTGRPTGMANPTDPSVMPRTGGAMNFPPWMQQYQPMIQQFLQQQQPQDPYSAINAQRAQQGLESWYPGKAMGKNHGGVGPGSPGTPTPPPPGPTIPGPQIGNGQPQWQSPANTYLASPTAKFLGMANGPPPDPRMMWHQQSGQYQLVPGYNGYNG